MVSQFSDDELCEMIKKEYLRRLTRYHFIDESMQKKYDMTFDGFEKENMVAQKNFSWEVESDAQEWEIAIDGIKTCQKKLHEFPH